jgi:hypothetical protein
VLDWLTGLLAISAPRPAHAPEGAVPLAQTAAATLAVRLEGARLAAIAAPTLWGATERQSALTTARILRNWLEEDGERQVVVLLPPGGEAAGGATGLDREIALILAPLERAERLRCARLPAYSIATAPRLSVVFPEKVNEFYGEARPWCALEGPLGGASHLWTSAVDAAWLTSIQSELRPQRGPLSGLTERLRVFRFRPGQPRELAPVFAVVAGRRVRIEIEDPWCGARPRNRESLAAFVKALANAGIEVAELHVIWNPEKSHSETAESQQAQMRLGLRAVGLVDRATFEERTDRGGHFHDRVVRMQTLDAGEGVKARWDVSSGIDNLMSRLKECSLLLEVLSA